LIFIYLFYFEYLFFFFSFFFLFCYFSYYFFFILLDAEYRIPSKWITLKNVNFVPPSCEDLERLLGYKLSETDKIFTYAHFFLNVCLQEIKEIKEGLDPFLDNWMAQYYAKLCF